MPGAQVPGEAHHVRRIPRQHGSPIALRALCITLVPPSPDARLNEYRLERRVPDVVRGRPPRLHLLHEHSESALDRRLNANTLTYDGFFDGVCHSFLHPVLVSGVVPRRPEKRSWHGSTSGRNVPLGGQRLPDPADITCAFRPWYR